jgi:ribosome-binding factor A
MSQRTEQISSVIRHAVQRVLSRGLNDPRIRGLVSVTKVEVTPDLAEARVHVSILPAEHTELTMHGLQSAARHIQSEIAEDVSARRLPRLVFKLDESLKKQAEIDAAISHAAGAHGRDESADRSDANDCRAADTNPAREFECKDRST